ncbi:SPOR domain-containing protein [Emticicia sp. BO119]|uniref:SPOR domain-containing protein n=1 Tax=Emticicia sp. BO119 TaxID=2757768 RepID=UPI0015F024E6|nr:SPOR domain-containing protein [Emticicia sp. BO119]MBA4849153.1 SPOR domain-containing protein [Emticicia sp. BO119]
MKLRAPLTLKGILFLCFAASQTLAQTSVNFTDALNKSPKKESGSNTRKIKITNLETDKSVVVSIADANKGKGNNKVAYLSDKVDLKANKGKIRIKEVEDDEVEVLWATAEVATPIQNFIPLKKNNQEKEIRIATTKIEDFDVNHIYDLNGKMQEPIGYGLQLGAFGQLKAAKDFANQLTQKGEIENNKIFIQVSKAADKPMVYRVIYGVYSSELNARNTQKQIENLGYPAFVKGFN